MPVSVARNLKSLKKQLAGFRAAGERVAFVPTMGALHEGHLSLVRLAKKRAKRVVVSIFVNPLQFAPSEDLAKYPRTFARDRALLGSVDADLIYAPDAAEIYPSGFCTTITLAGPAKVGLEDRFRPSHFDGVATVCNKLFQHVAPDFAVFGEKDFQQLAVIRRMVGDLDMPLTIIPGKTVRESDGLALSSRNRYLSAEQRQAAPVLHQALREAAADLRAGAPLEPRLEQARIVIQQAGFALDYLELRHADTLDFADEIGDAPLRLLVAATIGVTRLIDNIAV